MTTTISGISPSNRKILFPISIADDVRCSKFEFAFSKQIEQLDFVEILVIFYSIQEKWMTSLDWQHCKRYTHVGTHCQTPLFFCFLIPHCHLGMNSVPFRLETRSEASRWCTHKILY